MITTRQLVDLIRATTETGSKYAAAKTLGVANQTMHNWANRGTVMSDEIGIKAAETLEIEPEYVLACLQAERMKGSVSYHWWENIARRFEAANAPKKAHQAA